MLPAGLFRPLRPALLAPLLLLAGCSAPAQPDILYVPTPDAVVDAMLEMAGVEEGDVLIDLGSGDGRIPIAAARDYGIRAIGIEIDRRLVRRARANAVEAGVGDLVEFREGDMFEADLSEASVVTMYLMDTLNVRLRPKLIEELETGSRIVSHAYGMGEWEPDAERTVQTRRIFLWIVPESYIPGFGPQPAAETSLPS